MWENIMKFIRKIAKKEDQTLNSKDAAKERLHLVLMQDRANVSADFLELMKQEIIDVIKKYIEIDETSIDVRLTNKENGDGTKGAPALYANIPIMNIKDEVRQNSQNNIAVENKEKNTNPKVESGIDEESIDKSEISKVADEAKVESNQEESSTNIDKTDKADIENEKSSEQSQENKTQQNIHKESGNNVTA